jgi:methylenetetrahydrofolate dehydrogenase (NADP+) / methenyltetrahydrofolate cyclohydrolase
VQLPLPSEVEEPENGGTNKFDIFDAISPDKDVDGVGHESIATLYRAQQDRMKFLACTALAVRRMMSYYGVQTEGKQAVTIGRNDITAKPIMHMLGGRMCNAAAIWCHRYVSPEDQQRLMRESDIIVTSVGSEHFRITRDMVKPGVVIFDIATRVTPEGKLAGDVDRTVAEVASCMTPVPGGVGPVTVAALTENLFRAAQLCVGAAEPGYTF